MSVILFACYEVFVSDILITTEIQDVKTVDVPTFLNKAELYSNQLSHIKVINLKQKSYIINDLFALSLAGSVYEMKIFLGDIKSHFKHIETNTETIKNFFENYDKEIITKISVCFSFYHKGRGFYYGIFGSGWHDTQHYLFGDLSACGNGGKWFVEELNELLSETCIDQSENFEFTEHKKKIESLKSRIFVQLGRFIYKERFIGNTIKNLWGGGFEMVSFEGGRFKKTDDYTYVIISHRFTLDGELESAPLLAVNYKYYKDVLLLTCTDFLQIKRYVVTPIDMIQEEFDEIQFPTCPIFDSTRVIGHYLVTMPDKSERHVGFDYEHKNSEDERTVELSIIGENRLQYSIKAEFEDIVLGNIIADGLKMLTRI